MQLLNGQAHGDSDNEYHELSDLETANATKQNGHVGGHGSDGEEESDHEDAYDEDVEGERALLGSPQERTQRRAEGSYFQRLWSQIKDIVIESAPTLLLTTIGLLFTGELLDNVSRWQAMQQIDQLIMIIPVILNLKGNIEMNLSARLGTAANMGQLDDQKTRKEMVLGNLTLLQVQATCVSFVAACMSFLLGLVVPRSPPPPPSSPPTMSMLLLNRRRPRPQLPPERTRNSGLATFIMVTSTSISAACASGLVLGSFMCSLIIACRYFGWDPDNIAPPVASCLGDLVTLILLGLISSGLIHFLHTPLPFILLVVLILSSVSCLISTRRNPHVRELIKEGWTPLFGAMIISSATGIVLDLFVSRYEDFAVLAVVISGLPGSVGSIFVSRLSTELHLSGGTTTSTTSKSNTNRPTSTTVIITLIIITIPVEIIFLSVLRALGWLSLPLLFISFSVVFFCCAVTISLFIAQFLTEWLWKRGLDPDMYAMPIHSALMDLVGQLLLVLCFQIVSWLGVQVRTRAES